jgi:hypothetical protein
MIHVSTHAVSKKKEDYEMKKAVLLLLVLVFAGQAASAHDPRTVAKDFSHTMVIDGAGKLTVSYKSLHYNEPVWLAAKKNEKAIVNLNRLWKKIGKLDSEFDVVIGGTQVAKGSYDMGISFDANDNFKLILVAGGKEISIPLQAAMDGPVVSYLSFDVRPTSDTDSFELEGRYGKLRASAPVKVPYLAPHEHDDKKPGQ